MQRQRTTVESLPETFEFELGSSSANSVIDSPPYWSSALNEPNTVDFFLPPSEVSVPYSNAVNSESLGMSHWAFPDSGSSVHSVETSTSRNEAKMDHPWGLSTIPGPHGRTEDTTLPILENVDINLGGIVSTSEQLPSSNSGSDILRDSYSNSAQSSNSYVGFVDSSVLALGVGIYSEPRASGSNDGHLPSGNSFNISHGSSNIGTVIGDADSGPSGLSNERRASLKRKEIGVPEHSSDGASSSYSPQSGNGSVQILSSPHVATSLNIHRQSSSQSVAIPPEAVDLTSTNSRMSGVGSACLSSRSAGNTENSYRNVRMRTSPASQQDLPVADLQAASNSAGPSNSWRHPPPLPSPFIQMVSPMRTASLQTPSHPQVFSGIPWCAHPVPWHTRSAGPSPSPVISGERFISSREGINARNLAMNGTPEPPMIVTGSTMQFAQDPTNWTLSGTNINLQGSSASLQPSGSSIDPVASSNIVAPRSSSVPYQLTLELVRQSIASAGSSFTGQVNYNRFRAGHAAHLVRMASRGSRIRGEQLLPRSVAISEMQNLAASGDLSSQRISSHRDRRNRMMLSEQIRHVLGLIRSGENVRFEDLVLDQAALLEAADMHDRHRDMRLDVDNMSYEELLALEERIGNVSTGLSEETISKCLKQWTFLPLLAESSSEVEPCCICQEDYLEGEEMGTLDCGHDFHTMCIKQWLKQKNLCPICKKSALIT